LGVEEESGRSVLTDVVLPQMGLEVVEGTVVTLHVEVGAAVAEGDPLVEVETDKALTDVVAPRDGIVVGYAVEVGATVGVGATLLRLGDHAEDGEAPAEAAALEPVAAAVGGDGASAAAPAETAAGGTHRIRAAPVARRAAAHLGVALDGVAGTGPRGRITLDDVERAARERSAAPLPPPAAPGERLEPMSATRRVIARRMTESQQIPQFALERDIDATWLLEQKRRIAAETPVRVGVNDLLLQALAEVVVRTPDLASAYVPAADRGHPQVLRRDGVDVGLAVATERGLLVPVVRRAHERTLGELALERVRLTEAARSGRLDLAEMSGATVSLSSLASFGVDRFTAMLNPGESAILAVGRSVDRVVPRERGVAIVPVLSLTLTLDHRVVDGATGAKALAELAELLEGAMAWRA
jgi:pyruvate dehydrogenase E2 component (dihydrolipoamide acetyltransferase)